MKQSKIRKMHRALVIDKAQKRNDKQAISVMQMRVAENYDHFKEYRYVVSTEHKKRAKWI